MMTGLVNPPQPSLLKSDQIKSNQIESNQIIIDSLIVGLSDCRIVGLSDCRIVGLSDCRIVGLSDYRIVGLSLLVRLASEVSFLSVSRLDRVLYRRNTLWLQSKSAVWVKEGEMKHNKAYQNHIKEYQNHIIQNENTLQL